MLSIPRMLISLLAAASASGLFGAAEGRVTLEEILRPLERAETRMAATDARGDGIDGNRSGAEPGDLSDPTQYVGMDQVLPYLEEWMQSYLAEEGRLTVKAIRPWRGMQLPSEAVWEPVWGPEVRPDSRGLVYPELSVRVGDELYGPWTLAIQAELWREVLLSRQHLQRGEILSERSAESAWIDVLHTRGVPIPAGASLDGYEMARAVGEGEPLTWTDVASSPNVRRGDVVEVALVQGPLQIRMKAQAMEAGREGDVVVVRNLESRREFQAVVTGQNLVEVRL